MMNLVHDKNARRSAAKGLAIVLPVLGTLLFALPTRADLAAVPMTMTPIYMGSANVLNMIDAARRSTERVYGKEDSSHGSTPSHASKKPHTSKTSPANFSVKYDAKLSSKIKSQFLSNIRARSSAQDAASVAKTFANKPVHAAYLEAVGPYGLGEHDLRDVMTAYLVAGWMVANQADLPTVAQVKGVRHQLAQWLQHKTFSANSAQRQTASENMMYVLVSLIYARQEGQQTHNTTALNKMANLVANAFKTQNMDLRHMSLTNAGFAPR